VLHAFSDFTERRKIPELEDETHCVCAVIRIHSACADRLVDVCMEMLYIRPDVMLHVILLQRAWAIIHDAVFRLISRCFRLR
jgi:hypothetical protein